MSASQVPPSRNAGDTAGGDPSMEDILASIRRILSEEEPGTAAAPPAAAPPPAEKPDDVLVLDPSMLVRNEEEAAMPAAAPEPAPETASPQPLLAPETAAAASSSVGTLVRTLVTERTAQVHRGGPTIEDMVREELRPLLKQWLDAHLPDLVERLVRSEIERVVHRAMP